HLAAPARLLDRLRRVDEREVAERLGQVAQEVAVRGVDLLRVQAYIVGQADQLVHRRGGLVDAADARERLDDPEGAREEGALLLLHPAVAVDKGAPGA